MEEVNHDGQTLDEKFEMIEDMSELKHYVIDLHEDKGEDSNISGGGGGQMGGGKMTDPPLVSPEGYLVPMSQAKKRGRKKSINRKGGSKTKSVASKGVKGAGKRGSKGGGKKKSIKKSKKKGKKSCKK